MFIPDLKKLRWLITKYFYNSYFFFVVAFSSLFTVGNADYCLIGIRLLNLCHLSRIMFVINNLFNEIFNRSVLLKMRLIKTLYLYNLFKFLFKRKSLLNPFAIIFAKLNTSEVYYGHETTKWHDRTSLCNERIKITLL